MCEGKLVESVREKTTEVSTSFWRMGEMKRSRIQEKAQMSHIEEERKLFLWDKRKRRQEVRQQVEAEQTYF